MDNTTYEFPDLPEIPDTPAELLGFANQAAVDQFMATRPDPTDYVTGFALVLGPSQAEALAVLIAHTVATPDNAPDSPATVLIEILQALTGSGVEWADTVAESLIEDLGVITFRPYPQEG